MRVCVCVCVCMFQQISSNQPANFKPQKKDHVTGSISLTVDVPDIRVINIINFLYKVFRGTAVV